jgi:hypothetical protein
MAGVDVNPLVAEERVADQLTQDASSVLDAVVPVAAGGRSLRSR